MSEAQMSSTQALNAHAMDEGSERVLEWWRLDSALEKAQRLWASMAGHQNQDDRGPRDYDVKSDEVQKIMRGLGHLLARPPGNNYYEGGSPKDSSILRWIAYLLGGLLIVVIPSVFVFYGQFKALESTVNVIAKAHEDRIRSLEEINSRRYRGDGRD